MNETKVTIITISYNQEKFIDQTINSFLMQKTNFKFQVIIGDDASTDGTQKIILDYAEKYPDIIKPILRDKNIGAENNFFDCASYINSEYVILNEADDYFLDTIKLQKQVDFLDSNPDFSICFHPVIIKYEGVSRKDDIFPQEKLINNRNLDLDYLLKFNFIQTNSCMYRWRFSNKEKITDIFPKNILPGDHFLHLLHAEVGKIGFIPDAMAVYRKWSGGIWAGAGVTDAWFIKCGVSHIRFYRAVEDHFNVDRSTEIKFFSKKTLNALLINYCWDGIKNFHKEFPKLYDTSLNINKDLIKNHIFAKDSIKYIIYSILSKITFGRLRYRYNRKVKNLLRNISFEL